MVLSDGSPGFQDRERQASILVTELAAQSYVQAQREFTPDTFKLQGLEGLSREEVALPQGRGLMIAARPVTGSPR